MAKMSTGNRESVVKPKTEPFLASASAPQLIPESIQVGPTQTLAPQIQYVDREVIKYVDKEVIKEIRVEVPTIQYVDRIVPRIETKEVKVDVPYPVKTVEYVNVTHENIVNKIPVWAICVMVAELVTIVTLALKAV